MSAMLEVTNAQVLYNDVIEAVRDVSLVVPKGKIVALLGANGAGKSTLLKAISNVLYPEDGRLVNGRIHFEGMDLTRTPADQIVRAGLVAVPEGRRLFQTMTVEENVLLGAYTLKGAQIQERLTYVYALFPRIKEKRRNTAGLLSGGEQQMVAIGRALIGSPRLLMLDEPSLGLAPMIIEDIFKAVQQLNKESGLSILFVEQNAKLALEVAEYAYIMENGRIVLDGPAKVLSQNQDIQEFYLGQSADGQRKSLRDLKHYKRRKRWLS